VLQPHGDCVDLRVRCVDLRVRYIEYGALAEKVTPPAMIGNCCAAFAFRRRDPSHPSPADVSTRFHRWVGAMQTGHPSSLHRFQPVGRQMSADLRIANTFQINQNSSLSSWAARCRGKPDISSLCLSDSIRAFPSQVSKTQVRGDPPSGRQKNRTIQGLRWAASGLYSRWKVTVPASAWTLREQKHA
jgi:hypothetical protein